jgi:fumarate hydratase subunit alpha
MKEIQSTEITKHVARLCQEANFDLGDDVLTALQKAITLETSPIAIDVLNQIIKNARIAREDRVPMCQDCGVAVLFIELGQDVHVVGSDINEAINEGVRIGYGEGYLRKSMVANPLRRVNTGDNTPPVVYFKIVPGDKVRIIFAPKGAGSENMSAIKMLTPSDGVSGIKKFVIECVEKAGPNPCPPIIVGVGIGGTFEKSAIMAKEALLRPIGQFSKDEDVASLERELLHDVNLLGIGPSGFGGTTTALAVNIETYPCHIGSLPVAVNINCHAARHKESII